MGRHRKPPELHLLQGTFEASRHGGASLSAGSLKMPDWIEDDPVAVRFWNETIVGRISSTCGESDSEMAGVLCVCWSEWQRLRRRRSVDRQEQQETDRAFQRLVKLAIQFGLTPVARASLKIGPAQTKTTKAQKFFT